MKSNQLKINQIVLILFSVAVYLQMFAVNYKTKFGFAVSVLFLGLMLLFYWIKDLSKGNLSWKGFIPLIKTNSYLIGYLVLIILVMVLNAITKESSTSTYVLRVFKYIYCIFIIMAALMVFNYYINVEKALRAITIVTAIGCFYGLYQFVAPFFKGPFFLNIFVNSVSYGGKTLYSYYGGGWNGTLKRIYSVFSEPSFYGDFLVIVLLFIIASNLSKKVKIWLWVLVLSNIILTFARESWLGAFFLFFNWFLYPYFSKIDNKWRNWVFLFYLILIPVGMYVVNDFLYVYVFNDASMNARFYSQNFYLTYFFNHGHYLLGHGASSLSELFAGQYQIGHLEPYAHNGFIQILFEFGILGFLVFFFPLYYMYKKVPTREVFTLILVCALLFTFGEMYTVESILIVVVMVFIFGYKKYKRDTLHVR